MKSASRYALLCLASVSFPLAVACGSTDSSGLFSQGSGGSAIGVGGSSSSAGSTAQAGQSTQSASGSTSTSGGSSAGTGAAGQPSSNGGAAGAGNGVAGMSSGGSAAGGTANAGSANGGASSGAAGVGTGGASAGAGGANSSGAGGASSAGAGGVSGGSSGGTAGSGGASACPDMAPQEGVVCTVGTPDNCFYAGEACSCLSDGVAIDGRKWGCFGTPDKCPPQVPTDGTSCKNYGGGMCAYSPQDFCVCMPAAQGGPGADPKWACGNANPVCPLTRPDKNAPCADVKECDYVDRECFCDGAAWTCE